MVPWWHVRNDDDTASDLSFWHSSWIAARNDCSLAMALGESAEAGGDDLWVVVTLGVTNEGWASVLSPVDSGTCRTAA